jgi:hypothetical protein
MIRLLLFILFFTVNCFVSGQHSALLQELDQTIQNMALFEQGRKDSFL